jgi:hypothetical protein
MEGFRDFFGFCKCNILCPCALAQTPTFGYCEDVMSFHIKDGYYGQTSLDDLNLLAISRTSKVISGLVIQK